jgi:hypothetical protein
MWFCTRDSVTLLPGQLLLAKVSRGATLVDTLTVVKPLRPNADRLGIVNKLSALCRGLQ